MFEFLKTILAIKDISYETYFKNRILFFTLCLILIISGVLTWNGYSRFSSFNSEYALEGQKVETILVAAALDQNINSYFGALKSFHVDFNDDLEFANEKQVTDALALLKNTNPHIQAAFVALKNGKSFEGDRFFPGFNAKELKKNGMCALLQVKKTSLQKRILVKASKLTFLPWRHQFIEMAT